MLIRVVVLVGILYSIFGEIVADHETISVLDMSQFSMAKEKRYFIYDTNRGEGFNLRRDVYMRMANTVRMLREAGENFILVLPPWGGLYHWQRQKTKMPWSTYFDLESLNEFVPVMEFEQFLKENPDNLVDQVVYLQHYKEGWGKEYVMKYDRRECGDGHKYYRKDEESGLWKGWFFSFYDVRAKNFECISMQGDSETLKNMLLKEYPDSTSIFVDRGETALHHEYGEKHYWEARRSMRYSTHLIEIANDFRKKHFDSTDEKDGTVMPASWRDAKPNRQAKGGKYVCAHWRRKDFVSAHGRELPSIQGTAKLLNRLAEEKKVKAIYLATDADEEEISQLTSLVEKPLLRYTDRTLTDGEVAVVDQIVCSHAQYFIGSHVSTFSFRIQEDREILGFHPETTFNRMCPDDKISCEQPAKWKIVFN